MSVLCMLCEQEPATVFSGMGGEYSWCATCDTKAQAERTALWNTRAMDALHKQSLEGLLAFIRGEILPWLGPGITTYHDENESLPPGVCSKHDACLELERRGLIRRHISTDTAVTWLPR